MLLKLHEVAAAIGSSAPANPNLTGVCTDTRILAPGDLFVALTSPKDDGNRYVETAIRLGAAAIVASRPFGDASVPVLVVQDTTVAYGQIARLWRDRFKIPVVGVTGSVGKTTTKEMIAAALSPLGPVLKTEASQNNETGVPKALLQLTEAHHTAVVEMGMRGQGEIAALCAVARPTIGVVTLISDNHIELLGSKEAIADAKGELIASLSGDGIAVLNRDDDYFDRLAGLSRGRVAAFGRSSESEYQISDERREEDGWVFTFSGAMVRTSSPSRHDVSNAAAAMTVAQLCGISAESAASALAAYTPAPMRMEVFKAPGWGGSILNDAYNAAPASVKSALETLFSIGTGRRIAFLGDMKELGERAESAHKELGDLIETLGGLDALYTVGELAAGIGGATKRFASSAEAAQFAENEMAIEEGDVFLVKGSRAMAMERVVQALTRRGRAGRPANAG